MKAAGTTSKGRGDALLLSHCAAFGLDRPGPLTRLEREIGPQLAQFLVRALSRQGRPGSSSP